MPNSLLTTENRAFAVDIVQQLQSHGHVAYFAGGCVRDQLLGREPTDFDIATDAAPEQIITVFGSRHTRLVGIAFGVVTIHKRISIATERIALNVEVATFRTDGEYVDGRRPSSIRFATAKDDAQRRDFTINGMFYDPIAEQLHDFVGGEQDLQQKIIRSIGDASGRIAEDKLRMIRAIRFAARFNFEIEPETFNAICQNADSLRVVAVERMAQELRKISSLPAADSALRLLYESRLLKIIWPELAHAWEQDNELMRTTLKLISTLDTYNFELMMDAMLACWQQSDNALLINKASQAICNRLKLSNDSRDTIIQIHNSLPIILESHKLAWSIVQPIVIGPSIDLALILAGEWTKLYGLSAEGVKFVNSARQKSKEILDPPVLLTGHDLHQLGLTPGPQFAKVLRELRAAQLDEQINDRAAAIEFVKCGSH